MSRFSASSILALKSNGLLLGAAAHLWQSAGIFLALESIKEPCPLASLPLTIASLAFLFPQNPRGQIVYRLTLIFFSIERVLARKFIARGASIINFSILVFYWVEQAGIAIKHLLTSTYANARPQLDSRFRSKLRKKTSASHYRTFFEYYD